MSRYIYINFDPELHTRMDLPLLKGQAKESAPLLTCISVFVYTYLYVYVYVYVYR